MKAVHRPGLASSLWDDGVGYEQGSFEVITEPGGQRRFWFRCPGACKSIAPLALRPVTDASRQSWEWNGSTESPTLQPSINHVGCWHGWLTNGEFTLCQ